MKINIAREEYKNKIVAVSYEDHRYIVTAMVNGKIVGQHITADKIEAQEVYGNTVYEMYK